MVDTYISEGKKTTVKAGTVLEHEGKMAHCSYVIVEGEVASTRISIDGKRRYFWDSMLSGRDPFVCIPSIVSEKSLSVSIVAKKPSLLYRISSHDFNKLMNNDRSFTIGIARILADKFIRESEIRHGVSEAEPRFQFYKFLDNISQEYGKIINDVIVIELPMSHQEVAEYLGVDRTTVFRAFENLKRRGILDRVDNCYIIKDVDGFNKVCAEAEGGGCLKTK